MTRFRSLSRVQFAALLVLGCAVSSAEATTVTNLRAEFHDGQTFITWDNLPGTGWGYHVLSSSAPLREAADLNGAFELTRVTDESAIDRRMTSLLGQEVTYRIAENQPPLARTRGLFVRTAAVGALNYYAVIADLNGGGEDRTLVVGQNVTSEPVWERVQHPKPVWQRTLASPPGEDYALWTSNEATPLFPAMCNVPGRAYHVGVIQGLPGGALILGGHGRGGNFLHSLHGTGMAGEWVLSIDDYLPTADYASFYFGYEEQYDLDQPLNTPREAGGIVADYTEQRVMYLMDWAKRGMTYDPARVYAYGGSMGGSFAFFLAWRHPELVAASLAIIPKLCTGFLPDSYPGLRESLNRLWGSPDINLPTTAGLRVFQSMDGRELARIHRRRGSAPIVGFCGRNDASVGWAEKVAYFDVMQAQRAGGTWYWDGSNHYSPVAQMPWYPMMNESQLYKHRLDTSYPAFSNASSDGVYGNGDPATADPVGNINGVLDWNEHTISDAQLRWDIDLRTRGLNLLGSSVTAPDTVIVDVTPRRLQHFLVARFVEYRFEVRRVGDGALIQSGTATPDDDAVLTLPRIKVLGGGSRLSVFPTSTAGVTPELSARTRPHLALSRNPVQGSAWLTVEWPGSGDAVVELFDTQGRRMRTEFQGAAEGLTQRTFRSEGLAAGVYILCARQGAASATRRVTVLP